MQVRVLGRAVIPMQCLWETQVEVVHQGVVNPHVNPTLGFRAWVVKTGTGCHDVGGCGSKK